MLWALGVKGNMFSFTLCFILSIANLVYAAIIYLSLHGWLVVHEPSGMQLMVHLIITAPLTIVTTVWFFFLSKNIAPKLMWQVNLAGLFIPIMSMQTGVTYYHYDKVGLVIAVITSIILTGIYVQKVINLARS